MYLNVQTLWINDGLVVPILNILTQDTSILYIYIRILYAVSKYIVIWDTRMYHVKVFKGDNDKITLH